MNESASRATTFSARLITTGLVVVLASALAACSGPGPQPTPSPSRNAGAAGCLVTDQECLGVLDAGEYSSTLFDPLETGTPDQFRYVAPAGWANLADLGFLYSFRPADRYVEYNGEDGGDHWGVVSMLANPGLAARDASCKATKLEGGPTNAAGLAAGILGIPGVTVTPLPSQAIGSRTATVVEISIDSSLVDSACEGGTVPLFASLNPDNPWVWATSESEGTRIYFVDLDASHTVAIFINSPKADFAGLADAAEPLISTFDFATS